MEGGVPRFGGLLSLVDLDLFLEVYRDIVSQLAEANGFKFEFGVDLTLAHEIWSRWICDEQKRWITSSDERAEFLEALDQLVLHLSYLDTVKFTVKNPSSIENKSNLLIIEDKNIYAALHFGVSFLKSSSVDSYNLINADVLKGESVRRVVAEIKERPSRALNFRNLLGISEDGRIIH